MSEQLVPPSLRFGTTSASSSSTEQQQAPQPAPRRMSQNKLQQPEDSDDFAATTTNLPLPPSSTSTDDTVASPVDYLSNNVVPVRPAPAAPISNFSNMEPSNSTSPSSSLHPPQQHQSASRRVDPTVGNTSAVNNDDVNEDTDDHGVDVTRMNKSRLKSSTGRDQQDSVMMHNHQPSSNSDGFDQQNSNSNNINNNENVMNNNNKAQSSSQQRQNAINNNNNNNKEGKPTPSSSGDHSDSEEGDESISTAEELWIRRSWLRDFAIDNFACGLCRRLANDPVMVGDGDDELVCRRCYGNELAATSTKFREAPAFITRAVQQLRSSFSTALTLEEAAEEERKRNEPKLDVNLALRIDEDEASRRSNIALSFDESVNDLLRKHQVRLRSRMPGTSRQLKCEGDQKYEAQDYNGSYELYSRAIDVNDNTQKLGGMYANRSASLFMLMRFKECINDCQKAVEIDPTSGSKMWGRCQKAALQLGDLKSSLNFWELINRSTGGKPNEEQLAERQRLESGAERLAKIANSTPQTEVQDTYKLLMTRFPEVLHFRCMYCESMMTVDRIDEVISKLSQGYAKTPKACYLLAKAYYMSGFEEFPRAKATIVEFAEADAECRALKEKIFAVDDHKQKGNDLFSRKHFADSIVCYSSAIELASTNGRVLRVLYCNRAAAYKEVGKFKEGVEDCTKAISFDAKFVKAFARRARCLLGVQDFQSAVSDFKKACELEPTDPELARELRYAQRLAEDELAKEKDLYHVLGVSKTAASAEIKSRFRELSLKYHPDKCMGLPDVQRVEAERKFKVINEAYQTLSNQESRNKYDLADVLKNRRPFGGGAAGGGAGSAGFAGGYAGPSAAPNTGNNNPYNYRYGANAANAMPHETFRNAANANANNNNRYPYGQQNNNAGAGGAGTAGTKFYGEY